ncbi:MAG: hypothetical protein E5Y52_07110 [Mesorhizobium sp.]|nr:MAG: hypothetical protein E5Y52_07110 [Mesorhizobium sp.]
MAGRFPGRHAPLAYAMVFEATARLWDVFLRLPWEDVDADLVLRYVPSRTSAKTGLAVYDRATLEAAELFADARAAYRKSKTQESTYGNRVTKKIGELWGFTWPGVDLIVSWIL